MSLIEDPEMILASWPDREKVVLELSQNGQLWGVISEEQQVPILELYPHPDGDIWKISLADIIRILTRAQKRFVEDPDIHSAQLTLMPD